MQRLAELMEQRAEAAAKTRAGATHVEARPENAKDTRALEQTYLARGQAMRAEELLEHIQVLRFMPLRELGEGDPIESGALVALESDAGVRCVFLAPRGGGTEVCVHGIHVLVVTPGSPMGQALLGRSEGDEVELRSRGAIRAYEVIAVR